MDYTLAEYLSPAMDELGHSLAKQHLVTECGHHPGLLNLEYEELVRGAWLDREAGNLLMVDTLGHILHARHGKRYGYNYSNNFFEMSQSMSFSQGSGP